MPLPTDGQMDIAIMWLRNNEGDGGESDACRAVADWLSARQGDRFLRSEARKAGVPIAKLRARLAARAAEQTAES